MKDNGHGDTIKKVRSREELRKLLREEGNTLTRLDLTEFDFRNEQYLDNLLTPYGQYGKNYTLKEVYLSDTILKYKAEIVEYEKAGWSDAHTPSQEWAYAREISREVTFESMSDYDRKDYLGLGSGAKLTIVPHGQPLETEKKPEPKKDPIAMLKQIPHEARKILPRLDMSGADTSHMESMTCMFLNFEALKELDVSSFDTRNVISMENMFLNCGELTRLDLSGFKTSNVRNMYGMFKGCSSLTELDLSGFDFSKTVKMEHMFYGCDKLKTVRLSETIMRAPFRIQRGTGEYEPDWSGSPVARWENRHELFEEISFAEATDKERLCYLGLFSQDVELIIAGAEKKPMQPVAKPAPEKPVPEKPKEPVKAPVKSTPAPKPVEPAERPIPPQPIPQHVLDEMEKNRRKERKQINFWSWMIFVVVIIVAVLITLRT